ncbi:MULTISPECIES: heavy metal translocating P-type ATPase [Anaerococcus]|uniref:heavy metal translocating P-type ATPase n=1 Tax=Anaerococcus TaxID=165779 RepID=UPI002151DF93|nr:MULTISPECIES: heavy metal translocating P-type ATPase [Anaerococcus]MDU2599538.1 heavy metal translocating P-type ATPase [Anaerococcus sp.]MDU4026634.1 heavy metal translocating P-type ATPase [Anaerococcus sp.]MDU7412259.1 heavy metal translocating P-type ATPase [Anaerococcus sp.]
MRKLVIVAILTLVLSIYNHKYVTTDGIALVFAALYIFVGWDVLKKSIQMIKRGQALDEHFLMAIATITAFAIGQYTEAVAVMLFYSFGELFEEIATHTSKENIKSLLNLVPDQANLVNSDGSITTIDLDEVEVDDIILVRDGEKIGVDGVVVEGHGLVDTSSITGESMPVEVEEGSQIISSSIMTDGIIKIRAQKEFDDSVAAKIMELIEDSAASKSDSERMVTRFARYYTPIVVAIAVLLAIIPPIFFGGAWNDYLIRAATFLVLSCPCALVLSVPLSFMSGLGLASREGILIKGSQFFEILNDAEVLLSDKTGTLTTGEFKVQDIKFFNNFNKDLILDYIYNIELMSTHPIARGIVISLNRNEKQELFKEIKNEKGLGVSATAQNGDQIKLGSAKYVAIQADNDRAVYLSVNDKLAAKVIIEDQIKENSKNTIESLKKHFKEIAVVSGDGEKAVKETSKKLNLDNYFAEVMPDQKLEIMQNYQKNGQKTVFVGDGINDAPVLANADIGISMGETSSDLAIESSDVLIVNGEFSQMAKLMEISNLTNKTVRQNIIFIMLVKITILVMGLLGYANMWLAIFGDVGVSIIAIVWAMRILRKRIQ